MLVKFHGWLSVASQKYSAKSQWPISSSGQKELVVISFDFTDITGYIAFSIIFITSNLGLSKLHRSLKAFLKACKEGVKS